MFDWNDMRYFLAVVRTGSASGAAMSLKVNQSTVSRRIAALEQDLGDSLFNRTSNGHLLRTEMAWLLPLAEAMEDAAKTTVRELANRKAGVEGVVKVATVEEMATMLIAPELPVFFKQWPGIKIELLTGTRIVDLLKKEADVSLRLARPTQEGLYARKVGGFGYAAFAGQSYYEQITEQQLTQIETLDWMVLDSKTPNMPDVLWFDKHLPNVTPILRCTSPKTLIAAVQAGMGVAILPKPSAYLHPGLKRLPVDTRSASQEVWLAIRETMRDSPVIQAVMEFLIMAINKPFQQPPQ